MFPPTLQLGNIPSPLPRPLLRLAIDEVGKTGDPKGSAEVLVLVV